MNYIHILSLFEKFELDFSSALERSGCMTMIDLYEAAADEQHGRDILADVAGVYFADDPADGRSYLRQESFSDLDLHFGRSTGHPITH